MAFLASGAVLSEKQAKVLPGRLQMKRPRPEKSAPGGSNIEPRGGLLGGSRAPDGRQDRSGSAPGRLLGRSWRLLGRSWRLFGPSWPCQEVPGRPRGSGEGPREAILELFWVVQRRKLKKRPKLVISMSVEGFLVRVLALMFAICLLAWHASGEAANSQKS